MEEGPSRRRVPLPRELEKVRSHQGDACRVTADRRLQHAGAREREPHFSLDVRSLWGNRALRRASQRLPRAHHLRPRVRECVQGEQCACVWRRSHQGAAPCLQDRPPAAEARTQTVKHQKARVGPVVHRHVLRGKVQPAKNDVVEGQVRELQRVSVQHVHKNVLGQKPSYRTRPLQPPRRKEQLDASPCQIGIEPDDEAEKRFGTVDAGRNARKGTRGAVDPEVWIPCRQIRQVVLPRGQSHACEICDLATPQKGHRPSQSLYPDRGRLPDAGLDDARAPQDEGSALGARASGPRHAAGVDQQRHAVRLLKQVDIHGKMQVTLPKNGLSLAHHELTAPHDGRVGKVC